MALLNGEVKERPAELVKRVTPDNFYREAAEKGMSLSVFLESLDPSSDYTGEESRLDAFGRALRACGIRTGSDYTVGYAASTFQQFQDHEQARALIPEWAARRWREARTGKPVNQYAMQMSEQGIASGGARLLYTSADDVVGSAARPYFDSASEKMQQLTPDIRVADLVARTEGITGNAYRSIIMDEPAASDLRFSRVNEGAEIPVSMIRTSQSDMTIHKHGRGFMLTDEAQRRSRVDKIGFFLARAALQDEDDRVAALLDVAINGDGNSNAATVYNNTTITTGQAAGTLTPRGYLAFKLKFRRGYVLTTLLGRERDVLDLLSLNSGTTNLPIGVFPVGNAFTLTPMNTVLANGVRYAVTDQVADRTFVGMDTRFAIEQVFEVGASTNEAQRWASRQTDAFFVTEVEGYAVLDKLATKILNINA